MISECIRTNRCGDNRTRDQQWYPWSDIVLAKNEQTYGNLMAVMPEELFLIIGKTNGKAPRQVGTAQLNTQFYFHHTSYVILKCFKEVSEN